MNLKQPFLSIIAASVGFVTVCVPNAVAGLSCPDCHADKHTQWAQSAHAKTQVDVANELAQSHPGESPGAVVQGEDCIACHGPAAVLANAVSALQDSALHC